MVKPEKPKLVEPEIKNKNVVLKWNSSEKNKSYRLEVALTKSFDKIMLTRNTKKNQYIFKDELPPTTYFWRVVATNDSKREVTSSVAEFSVEPPLEKITIVDYPEVVEKKYAHRFSIAWAPSFDTYDFKNSETKGSIEGNTVNAVEGRGIYFTEKLILSADLLRQSGKVFGSEKYLFQRFQVHASWKKKIKDHLWGAGLSLGSVAGYSYKIDSNDEVSTKSVTGFLYGPHIEGFYTINPMWELQGRAAYMMGAIPHVELTSEVNRKVKNFFVLAGAVVSMREYENEGSQTSFRFNIGLGQEF